MKVAGDYYNSIMQCEIVFCRKGVKRGYMPFCDSCFRKAVSRGCFISRDGKDYRYDGRRWVLSQNGTLAPVLEQLS